MNRGRRRFLGTGGVAAAALLGAPVIAAAEWTAAEKAVVQVVNGFCAAWTTGDVAKIVSYMSEDVLFRNGGTPPMKGRQASFDRIKGVFAQYPKIEFEVVETFAKGPIVMNERNDWLDQPGAPRRLIRVVGVFMVKDGKIAEWTDYGLR